MICNNSGFFCNCIADTSATQIARPTHDPPKGSPIKLHRWWPMAPTVTRCSEAISRCADKLRYLYTRYILDTNKARKLWYWHIFTSLGIICLLVLGWLLRHKSNFLTSVTISKRTRYSCCMYCVPHWWMISCSCLRIKKKYCVDDRFVSPKLLLQIIMIARN